MQRIQKLITANALLVILAAMFAGFMLGFSLTGGLEVYPGKIIEIPWYGTTEGWARAHTGGVLNGLLMIGVALSLPLVPLSAGMQRVTAYGFIFVGWANTAFYWFGNAAGSRALSFGDNPLGASNLLGVIGYGAALVGAILIVWLLGYMAFKLFTEK